MTKRFHAALAALILLAFSPALAADNYQVKDATGATLTLRSRDTGNGQSPQFVVGDPAGAAFLTPANPGYFTLAGPAPLPAGAATAAKQPALGAAGAPSADVLTIQGAANGTPIPTIGSQPSNIATGQVSCGTTASVAVAARAGRRNVLLIQEGTTLVRVGGSTVTTSNGAPLPGTAYSAMTLDGGAAIYCVTASGTQTVSYVESY